MADDIEAMLILTSFAAECRQAEDKKAARAAKRKNERCSYVGCENPFESRHFYKISGDKTIGGRDWSSLAGTTLCSSCYSRYRDRGTLEKSGQNKPLPNHQRRCTYEGCEHPDRGNYFYQIDDKTNAGGQDWSSLAGGVLCKTCYSRFRDRGTLERSDVRHKPLAASERRCSYAGCEKPEDGNYFYQIDERTNAGAQDWSSLAGSVLCRACFQRFKSRGTLERTDRNKPLAPHERKCSYEGCKRPGESRQFVRIDGDKTAGGQDWAPLAGKVLCHACYMRYKDRGTLEYSEGHKTPLLPHERRCTYAKCDRPDNSNTFFQIDGKSGVGGQDWTPLAGSVLCRSCYSRFRYAGTLERGDSHRAITGAARRCTNGGCERPEDSAKFVRIDGSNRAGGRDWTQLVGSVLCSVCYSRYVRLGTLERPDAPPAGKKRRGAGGGGAAEAKEEGGGTASKRRRGGRGGGEGEGEGQGGAGGV